MQKNVLGTRRERSSHFFDSMNDQFMWDLMRRLVCDERGQDLVEYALLTAGIGLAGIATWPLITAAVGAAYQRFDTDTQNIWEVPDPGA